MSNYNPEIPHYTDDDEKCSDPGHLSKLIVALNPHEKSSEKKDKTPFQEKNDNKTPRYGSVEQSSPEVVIAEGAAASAIVSGTVEIIKQDSPSDFASAIKGSVSGSLKTNGVIKSSDALADGIVKPQNATTSEAVKPSEAAIFAENTWGSRGSEKQNIFKTTARVIGVEVERSVGQGGSNGDISERAAGSGIKYGYKAGKYALLGGISVGRGTYHMARYGKKLSNDVASGVMTTSEATTALIGQTKKNIAGAGNGIAGVIKTGAFRAIEDFHGSDDLGMQSITKPKDAIVKTTRSLQMVNSAGRSLVKGVKATKKAAESVKNASKAVVSFGRKLFTNPVFLKSLGIAALGVIVIALMLSVVNTITSIIPVLSLKSEDWELTQAYLYITELDARMEEGIKNEDTKFHSPPINVYHYYLNGVEISKENMLVFTNADLLLALFDSKYDDYSFDGIVAGLFGNTVKGEIREIHTTLHQVTKTLWMEEIEQTSSYIDLDTGLEVDDSWIEYIYHMDIRLTTKKFEEYFENNKDELLDLNQQEAYNALLEVGIYSFRKELNSPFIGVNWSAGVTSRFGWRLHPITGELGQHNALDIALPGGYPINAVMPGIVSIPPFMSGGYGNYVVITSEDGNTSTLYAHMSSISVSSGQRVDPGDVIGFVGTTGASTGNHLHLEYKKNGHTLNPLFFVYCEE